MTGTTSYCTEQQDPSSAAVGADPTPALMARRRQMEKRIKRKDSPPLRTSWKRRTTPPTTTSDTFYDDDDENDDHSVEPVADPVSSRRAARAAHRASKEIVGDSQVLSSTRLDEIPRFKASEIKLGKILGEGGFSTVYEISSIQLRSGIRRSSSNASDPSFCSAKSTLSEDHDNADSDADSYWVKAQEIARKSLAQSAVSRVDTDHPQGTAQPNEGQYCLKHLSIETMSDPKRFKIGAVDLVIEASFLSCMVHPNIAKLRGTSSDGARGFASGMSAGYFLIMDRLYGTLDERIKTWSDQMIKDNGGVDNKSMGGLLKKVMGKTPTFDKSKDSLAERMRIAPDVASALSYLHENGIIFRDLKPDNIGFDCHGNAKLFDFGLAKEVNNLAAGPDGTYLLSGNTGSLRFMAPEVARCEPYNLSADVYSYSIVLWQILSLTKPYAGMDRCSHADRVVYGVERPHLGSSWPHTLRDLLRRGWHPNHHRRPNMEKVHRSVVSILGGLDGGSADSPTTGNELQDLSSKKSKSLTKAPVRAMAA